MRNSGNNSPADSESQLERAIEAAKERQLHLLADEPAVQVACVRSTARRFAKPVKRGGKQLFYRGIEIVPTRKSSAQLEAP